MVQSVFLFAIVLYPVLSNAKITALILARGGSKGIYLKNLQEVDGISLLRRCLLTAKLAGLDDVTVSTDHFLIALEAIKGNARVFRRSKVSASDWAPSIWGASEFLASRPDTEILVLLQATSPFIKPVDLKKGLDKIKAFDCVFSVTRVYQLRWRTASNGILKPINFNILLRPRRQDWSGELLETGAFYISRRYLIEQGTFQNFNCSYTEISNFDSFEIDTYYDLEVANVLLSSNLV